MPALRKALAGPLSLEARRLERVEAPARSPEHLLGLRAIRILAHIGSPEARQVLEVVAKRPPEALRSQEAKASLERVSKRYLVQVAAHNLGLLMRKLFGKGKPRTLQDNHPRQSQWNRLIAPRRCQLLAGLRLYP